jgi:hypothetical protein
MDWDSRTFTNILLLAILIVLVVAFWGPPIDLRLPAPPQ